ncbi:MAG: SH3 domain-containing protein [Spirochaetota bacterium]
MARAIMAFLLLFVLSGALFAVSTGDTVAVSVREGALRSAPGFLGAITERVLYGASATVLSVRGDWVRVRVDETGTEGWLHSSAVLPPAEMNLTGSGSNRSGTTSREIALAGRGFNERVEQEYRQEEQLDFDLVDEMETYTIPPVELGDFLEEVGAGIAEAE